MHPGPPRLEALFRPSKIPPERFPLPCFSRSRVQVRLLPRRHCWPRLTQPVVDPAAHLLSGLASLPPHGPSHARLQARRLLASSLVRQSPHPRLSSPLRRPSSRCRLPARSSSLPAGQSPRFPTGLCFPAGRRSLPPRPSSRPVAARHGGGHAMANVPWVDDEDTCKWKADQMRILAKGTHISERSRGLDLKALVGVGGKK